MRKGRGERLVARGGPALSRKSGKRAYSSPRSRSCVHAWPSSTREQSRASDQGKKEPPDWRVRPRPPPSSSLPSSTFRFTLALSRYHGYHSQGRKHVCSLPAPSSLPLVVLTLLSTPPASKVDLATPPTALVLDGLSSRRCVQALFSLLYLPRKRHSSSSSI